MEMEYTEIQITLLLFTACKKSPVAYANEHHKTADPSVASHCDSLIHHIKERREIQV